MQTANDLRRYIRDVPDFPKPGIIFKDITPLLRDAGAFDDTIELLIAPSTSLEARCWSSASCCGRWPVSR